MSLARDDLGYLSAIDALETSFLKTESIEKKENEENTTGPKNSEPEFNDVFENRFGYTGKEQEKELEKAQEEYSKLEIKNESLKKINSDLAQINNALIENDNNKPENSEKSKEKEQALEKINALMSGVREKQSQITEMQRELQQTVSSLVELNIGENADSVETEIKQAEELKQSIMEEVKENPEVVKKLQIKNIDRNLLLAMLTLRK